MAGAMAEAWQAWIGRSERRTDRVGAGLVRRWLATFDRDGCDGNAAPQGLHWCLCLPDAPTAALGEDGHPRRDDDPAGFLPPVPLPRRMWASSAVEFIAPIALGAEVERTSTVTAIREKAGASGPLVFVEITHETLGNGLPALREVQSVVYRGAAVSGGAAASGGSGAGAAPPQPFEPAAWDAHRAITPSETLLFRYSALTFNSHRIHYDLPYARDVEGYRGLVVHGPLTASLLLDLARRSLGDNALKRFAFRGMSPAICGERLHLAMRGQGDAIELAAFAEEGREIMAATAGT
ncbi:MAG: MaoC family dehydratase N-terminal domain-containing protein [Novosphingobium sp.]